MRNVSYNSTVCFNCSKDGAAFLCLDSSLVASGLPFIPATVLTPSETLDLCGCPMYRYIISYDEALLADPEYYLVAIDIKGIVCESCLTDWVTASIVDGVSTPTVGEWTEFTFLADDDQGTAGEVTVSECFYKVQDGDLLFDVNFHFIPDSTTPHLRFNPATALPAGDFKARIFAWAVEAPSSSEDAGDQQFACRALVDKHDGVSQTFVIHRSDDAIDNTMGNNHYEFAGSTEYQISFSGRARLYTYEAPEPQ